MICQAPFRLLPLLCLMALSASASAKFNDGKSRRLSSPINPGYYGKKELNRRLKGIDSSSNDETSLSSSSVDTEWSWSQSEDTGQDSTDDRRKLKKKKKRKAPKKKPSAEKKKKKIMDETTTKKKQKKKSSPTAPPPPTVSQTRAPTPPPSTFPPKISNIEPSNDDLVG